MLHHDSKLRVLMRIEGGSNCRFESVLLYSCSVANAPIPY